MTFPYYQPSYQPYPYQQQQSGMLWVSNEQEAYSYPVAPNAAVALWDSSRPTVYVKQADPSGKPTLKILDYSERSPSTGVSAAGGNNNTTYATKDDITKISQEIEALKGKLKGAAND